jgi:hypothetical protein
MNKENQVWTMSWTQPYSTWPKSKPAEHKESEITDFTEARQVLARIMQKRT